MYKIFSEYDCLLKFDNKEIFLDKNEHAISNNACKIDVYPIGKSSAYPFVIDLAKLEKSRFYRYVTYHSNCYIFFVESLPISSSNIHIFPSLNTEVEIGKNIATFKTNSTKKSIEFPFSLYSCKNIKNLIVCSFEGQQNLLAIFNPQSNKIKVFTGNFLLDENFLTIQTEFFDSKFLFSDDGLKFDSYVSHKKIPQKLLPYQFMLSIKNENYQFAHSLLDRKCQNEISIANLKNFLPDLEFFKFVEENSCIAISQGTSKILTFTIVNDKILDIESD